MADSNITKKALAEGMKKLMSEKPFAKISITDICELCGMNRKTFYYHFQDKYELVNWIFDIEFISVARQKKYTDSWEMFSALFAYFDENREFYRNALTVTDYNSFRQHFHELLSTIFTKRMSELFKDESISDKKKSFCIHVLSDAFISAAERWLTDKEKLTAVEFCEYLHFIFDKVGSAHIMNQKSSSSFGKQCSE